MVGGIHQRLELGLSSKIDRGGADPDYDPGFVLCCRDKLKSRPSSLRKTQIAADRFVYPPLASETHDQNTRRLSKIDLGFYS